MMTKTSLALALVLGGMTTAAIAQITMRPVAPVSPAVSQAVANTDINAARIQQLTARVDALTAELKAAQNSITGLQNAMKTTSLKGFENAGNLAKLNKQYQNHRHYYNHLVVFQDINTKDISRNLYPHESSLPMENCTQVSKWNPQMDGRQINPDALYHFNCAPPAQ
jgi:hypothetical protein